MAEKKKILYIVEAMGGGVFTYIVDLANELVNSYDMYIAYAVRKQTPQNYKDYFDKRIHLIEVKNFGRVIDPAKDIAAFFEVKKIAAKIKPDVIHLHSSKAGAIGRVAFNGKIPMFYTPHGYSFLMENYKPMKRRMFKVIESVCAKRNCTTISCSVGEHQESLKLTKHATYVNNGINMAELQEIIDKTEKVEHPFTVYTLGRICYQKNPTLFNEIAESLPDVKFVWIGDGELRDQLTSENIEITGWADRSTAIRYAVNADVFLLPSRWEGLPISLLESMYMKKACVVSNVIGNRDVIHNGENGFVCTKVEDFVKAIEECQGEVEKLTEAELGNKCKDNYSSVLVGSDQLWLPGNIAADYYTLNFVPETVNSIAYATSFGQSSLPKNSAKKAEVFLKKIKHIGVREESGQKLVKEIANRDVPVVCDPTLLFTGDEWMAIQQKEPIIKGKYILCYFLGNNPPHREFAKRLKEVTGCKIIALTHLDEFVKSDEGYADETPYDIDPADFLNLIRNAEYVCTDSFHCSVFSILYKRQFFTFRRYNRNTKQSTNSRLDTLFHMAGITGRLLTGEENMSQEMYPDETG